MVDGFRLAVGEAEVAGRTVMAEAGIEDLSPSCQYTKDGRSRLTSRGACVLNRDGDNGGLASVLHSGVFSLTDDTGSEGEMARDGIEVQRRNRKDNATMQECVRW